MSSVAAIWLGAMNPLVIIHLVGGIHNEALMLGLMLVGMEVSFRAIYGARRLRRPGAWLPSQAGWLLIAGGALIARLIHGEDHIVARDGLLSAWHWPSAGATPPALRHAPIGQWWLRSRRSVIALSLSAAFHTAVLVAVMAVIGLITGLGFGWIRHRNDRRSGAVVDVAAHRGVGGHRRAWDNHSDLGDHTQTILDTARPLAQVVAGLSSSAGCWPPSAAGSIHSARSACPWPRSSRSSPSCNRGTCCGGIPLAAWATDRGSGC